MKCSFSLLRLWKYLNIYFLKPFDAVNDTITSDLLLKLNWKNNYTEIGSGDGAFSYIMHGGSFPISFDRYLSVNLNNKDIFKTIDNNKIKFKNKKLKITPHLSVDAKKFHVEKIKKINFSKKAICNKYENLNIKSNSTNLIFCYTPHGLVSHKKLLKEISRVLNRNGSAIILLYLENVKNFFICDQLYKKTTGSLKKYFKNLDNGRCKEISVLANTYNNWKKKFENLNLFINSFSTGLHPYAWVIYDLQTRPFLKLLINFFNFFTIKLRTLLKLIWMILFFPFISIVYILLSNLSKDVNKNCYIAFELKKNNRKSLSA